MFSRNEWSFLAEMIYEEPKKFGPKEIEEMLRSDDPKLVQGALLSLSLYGDDWREAQDQCLKYILDANTEIAAIAILCLGHIGRIHKNLEKKKVIDALKIARGRKELSGRVDSAISDIEIFVTVKT